MKKNIKSLIYLFFPLTYYYIGPLAFVAYLYSLRSLFFKWRYETVVSVLIIFCFCIFFFARTDPLNAAYNIRFFWGWTLFYLFFSSGYRVNVRLVLSILSLAVIGEAILINSLISAKILPNYPDADSTAAITHFVSEEHYQRPYSFGGSASVTSGILVALLAYSKLNLKAALLPIAAILSCMSGTGFFLLIFYLMCRFAIKHFVVAVLVAPLIILIFYSNYVYKFSIDYFTMIYNYKVNQLSNYMSEQTLSEFLFGGGDRLSSSMGGDFQLLSFMEFNGALSFLVFFAIVFLNLRRINLLPIIILITGSIHYGLIFYFPGQVIFGYFLALGNSKQDSYEYSGQTVDPGASSITSR